MPTFNQLVKQGRKQATYKSNSPAMQYGLNTLKPPKKKSALLRFFLQIHQPLIYVLILSATLALFLGEYVDATVIYGVVLGNAIMGFWQENAALKGLARLS